MYNCYNIAFNYLKGKYGVKNRILTSTSSKKFSRATNKKERKEIENSFTDSNYYGTLNPATEEQDKIIELLMGQYNYGLAAKKDLYYVLMSMGLVEEIND